MSSFVTDMLHSVMLLMLTVQLALSAECPGEDIYAVGLNAYVLTIDEEEMSLEMRVEEGQLSERKVVQTWRAMLQSCQKENVQVAFELFIQQTDNLYKLGLQFQNTPIWSILERRQIRLEIRKVERLVALLYVDFLRSLQQETGVAVRWNKKGHILTEGMISTAGGSDLVADYVERVWE